MASISTDVRLEELLAQKTIVRDNGCAIITIPGFASLSGADRRALGEKVV
jgi:hypothetical protein